MDRMRQAQARHPSWGGGGAIRHGVRGAAGLACVAIPSGGLADHSISEAVSAWLCQRQGPAGRVRPTGVAAFPKYVDTGALGQPERGLFEMLGGVKLLPSVGSGEVEQKKRDKHDQLSKKHHKKEKQKDGKKRKHHKKESAKRHKKHKRKETSSPSEEQAVETGSLSPLSSNGDDDDLVGADGRIKRKRRSKGDFDDEDDSSSGGDEGGCHGDVERQDERARPTFSSFDA
eukprot:scaffold1540_cov359-Prasinococcus_capsulatus_cf.AAC.5